jgi:hypothetical protein
MNTFTLDDMGKGVQSSCPLDDTTGSNTEEDEDNDIYPPEFLKALTTNALDGDVPVDPGGEFLPLVYQDAANNVTRILEQPLDFTTLARKYNTFALDFIEKHKEKPFFLYMPFSHVHTTRNTPEMQYGKYFASQVFL